MLQFVHLSLKCIQTILYTLDRCICRECFLPNQQAGKFQNVRQSRGQTGNTFKHKQTDNQRRITHVALYNKRQKQRNFSRCSDTGTSSKQVHTIKGQMTGISEVPWCAWKCRHDCWLLRVLENGVLE